MAGESPGLSGEVRRKLSEGTPSDRLVDELVARGLSRPNAERFVDRAIAELSAAAREASRSVPDNSRSLERAKLTATLLAVGAAVVIAAIGGAFWWRAAERERERQAAAAAELAAADRARAEQIRAESAARREGAAQEISGRRDARADEAFRGLSSKQPMTQCDAALLAGRIGATELVPVLKTLMSTSPHDSVRACAVSALGALGETELALNTYLQWANSSDPSDRRTAIRGFGQLGPSVAGAVLPHLTAALKSPHMEDRYLAVESLEKLGPAGVPLLEVAAGDTDTHVRARAAEALRRKPRSP